MQIQWIILISLYTLTSCEEDVLLARTHSTRLEKYAGYVDTAILHFKLPQDTHFASFQFQAEELALSLFKCESADITLYLKYGSPPVINPDGSKFPKGFLKQGRPELHPLEFKADNVKKSINITSPRAGSYFASAFITYTDPRHEGITQQGLTPDCPVFMNAALYVKQKPTPIVMMSNRNVHVLLATNTTRLYKFFVPEIADSAVLDIADINFCENCTELQIKIQPFTIPAENNTLHDIQLQKEDYDAKTFALRFATIENCWYYLTFVFDKEETSTTSNEDTGQFLFKLYYLSFLVAPPSNATQHTKLEVSTKVVEEGRTPTLNVTANNSVPFKRSIMSSSQNEPFNFRSAYTQYNLMRDGHTESYMFSFDLPPTADGTKVLALNITETDVHVLKFRLNEGLDIGGTLQFSLAFKPRMKTEGKIRMLEEEPEGHTIIGCIRNGAIATPTWPNKCVYNEETIETPITIKRAADNNTLYVPYPEPGDWYASFKLFCGDCATCKCSDACKKQYRHCSSECKIGCENSTSCDSCAENCEQSIASKSECASCDCNGPCQRSKTSCSSSVIFDVSSYPCVSGKCGRNGRCIYLVSEGLAYTACVCSNNYRGWDCTDDSQASSYSMIMLELLLLVLSNLIFLPAAFEAYRRGYNVEAIVYFSTCFFSTFYHACDAGENVYSFCLVRLSALQFADFFCGLLSIWVTIIAMAYLPTPWTHICHIAGAILLSFFTTINKTALWVFALPFLTGMLILIVSWYLHYKKTGTRFPSKRYLYIIFPTGLITVVVGLSVYALLQTQENYKYLHSMWHMLMAFAIIILLPNKRSFLPPAVDVDSID